MGSDPPRQATHRRPASTKLGPRPRAKKCRSIQSSTKRPTTTPARSSASAAVTLMDLSSVRPMLGHAAVGTWSGGGFMRFGEPIDDARLEALLRPGDGIATVMTADAYGAGEADTLLGR